MTPKQALKLAEHPKVKEVEGEGCDDGVYFVHLIDGFDFDVDKFYFRTSKTFDSYQNAVQSLKGVIPIVTDTKRY